MAYVKTGPFNNAAPPAIGPTFLNNLETFLASTNMVNGITGWYHVDQYGAKGDGVTDDRAAIQSAIDAAGAAYTATGARQRVYLPPRIHTIIPVIYTLDSGTADSSAVGLIMRDGIDFFGTGTVKMADHSYGPGAALGVFRAHSTGLSYASIRDITVDGNKTNQVSYPAGTAQASNIVLQCVRDVEIIHVRSLNANGQGIQLVGNPGAPAYWMRLSQCEVFDAANIGIQVSHFVGLELNDNLVAYCAGNAIDVYGEHQLFDGVADGTPDSGWSVINGNRTRNCAVGIFLETVFNMTVTGNHCANHSESGVHVNRVNGAPVALNIASNVFWGCPYGAYFTGDTGSVTFQANIIYGASAAGVILGGPGGNAGSVKVVNNTIDTSPVNSNPLFVVASGTNQSSFNVFRGTITQNTNRSLDWVDNASTKVGNNYQAANA